MQKNNTDPEIVMLVEDYLQLRGESTMQVFVNPFLPRKYHLLVKYHDKQQRDYISTYETYQTSETCAIGFREQL